MDKELLDDREEFVDWKPVYCYGNNQLLLNCLIYHQLTYQLEQLKCKPTIFHQTISSTLLN